VDGLRKSALLAVAVGEVLRAADRTYIPIHLPCQGEISCIIKFPCSIPLATCVADRREAEPACFPRGFALSRAPFILTWHCANFREKPSL